MSNKKKIFLLTILILLIAMLVAPYFNLILDFVISLNHNSSKFLLQSNWFPDKEIYGSFHFLINSMILSVLAVLFSFPFALSLTIFLKYYSKIKFLSESIKNIFSIVNNFPSIIIGIWAFYSINPKLFQILKVFNSDTQEFNLFATSIILSIMLLPVMVNIFFKVFAKIPEELENQALSLGATKYDMLRLVSLPYSIKSIIGGIMFSLGRVLGEGLITTMLIGLMMLPNDSLFASASTITTTLFSSLILKTIDLPGNLIVLLSGVLFIFVLLINLIAKKLIDKRIVII